MRCRLLLFGILLLLAVGRGMGYERPFPTYLALGGIFPINSNEGRRTPIVVIDHEAGDRRSGLLKALLRTAVLQTSYTHQPSAVTELKYGGRLTLFAEGSGGDLYRKGRHLTEKTYTGNGAAVHGTVAFYSNKPWSVGLEVGFSRAVFSRGEKTAVGYQPPPAYSQGLMRMEVRRKNLFSQSGFVSLAVESGWRLNWQQWALDNTTDRRAFARYAVQYEDKVVWSEFTNTHWALFVEDGRNLDLFSGGRVGGFTGVRSLAGYYRNEFRTQSHVVLNVRQEFWFAKDRMMWVWLDGGQVQLLELDYLQEAAGTRQNLLGIAVGFRYDLRSLHGLPVFFNYGHGLLTPKDAVEAHRREFAVIVAAGF
ncbi:MAG: hypothetical protein OSB18_09365 [SAR324 cluster bacterium]|nr:hypothetical protein [SAR324 cluster bacterium]